MDIKGRSLGKGFEGLRIQGFKSSESQKRIPGFQG
jgi:hypothetical protein